jgi:hypothetical protein
MILGTTSIVHPKFQLGIEVGVCRGKKLPKNPPKIKKKKKKKKKETSSITKSTL